MSSRRGSMGSGIRRGWSVRAVGLLVVVGLAGFVAAHALGMSRGLAGAPTSAPATTTLPSPDPPPVTKPKPRPKPKPTPKPKVRSVRRAATPKPQPPPAPVPAQATTTYVASPPPAPAQTTVAPAAPKQHSRHRARHRPARRFHKPPKRKVLHRDERP